MINHSFISFSAVQIYEFSYIQLQDLDVLCHRVAVKEIGSKELPSHGFVVETLVKEIISPEAEISMK